MDFDLFYELAVPPQLGRSELQTYHDALEELALADRLGFRCAWLVEHHFMAPYSHCSKPELVLAAAAQRTQRLRLGFGVIPMPLHHPVHVAERVATLDLLSRGRLEVGVGRGFSPREFEVFGVPMEESRERVEEALEILRRSFLPGPLTYHGRHYRLEALDVVPRAIQTPHPPLWTAAVSPQTFEWAAHRGLGVLVGPFKPWFMVRHDLERYRDAWTAATPPRAGMTIGVLCLEDGERARRLAAEAFTWFYRELYRTTLPVLESLYSGYEHFRELGRFRALIRLGIHFSLLERFGMVVAGDPAECVQRLRTYEAAGVTHLLLAVGAGAVPTEVVQESLACLATHVLPHFSRAADPG
ncbi:MAG: LLM class flavin-dependent oxidoreductase [Azospira oryzae]|nr:MAG: LLM class flavin-dependent oxidoreductase [Azospira oryzae]PZP79735.1 MAG: LLM class flavin-dependent oxidoreductase [Azospira oryzae]